MTKVKTVDAIVRGPRPVFRDSVLYAPGQIVQDVPEDEVSDEKSRIVEVEVENGDGELIKRRIERRYLFRPIGGATVNEAVTTADIATGDPARLNVTDFLKQGTDEIVAAIVSGSVDAHIGAIEQAEIARRGPARVAVKEAIAARLAAIRG
ncbi:hypothetical protein [Sphingopyxis macrogoltabida]|uniref:Uncharacterized protein n=1 Tax=Sphingopyxis macrogoltabida TaxID=33050 RepID=A0AAC9AXJ3_SPHMC|nr:hypothetical protein [Sphingopyxis macrogoltabida]ALJ15358.1 hypothetical protein LH19_20985 [Sphingopyxis macrogoltabida]AMU91607.1 hypothetical protein ATM17_21565 [Sphingopyxis macrogoltabida]